MHNLWNDNLSGHTASLNDIMKYASFNSLIPPDKLRLVLP